MVLKIVVVRNIFWLAGLAAFLGGCSGSDDGGSNLTQRMADRTCARSMIYPDAIKRAQAAEQRAELCETNLATANAELKKASDLAVQVAAQITAQQTQIATLSAAIPLESMKFTFMRDAQATCIEKMTNIVARFITGTPNATNAWVTGEKDSCRVVVGCPTDGQFVVMVTCREGDASSIRQQIEDSYS